MFPDDLKPSQPYHHGDVKNALINAAMKLIDTNELEAMSLRRLAKEVGVTPSAVYNHFTDKDALMMAIKISLYEDINRYFDSHYPESDDPEQTLLDMCYAYFHFSREFPSQFHFIFSSTLPLEWSTPEFVKVSCYCLVKARKAVYGIFEKYQVPCKEEDVVGTTLLVWSQLHGIVMLRNSGSIPAAVTYQEWPSVCGLQENEEVENLLREHVQMTVDAILSKQRNDSHH